MKFKHNPLISTAMSRLSMNILDCCHCVLDNSWRSDNACAGFTRIYCVIGGCGYLHFKDYSVKMLPGHIYVLPTGLNFSYECNSSLEKVFIHVKLSDYNGCDVMADISECFVFDDMAEEIAAVKRLSAARDVMSAFQLKSYIYNRLIRSLERFGTKLGDIREYSALTTSAIGFIENHLHSGLTVRDVSSSLYVSESHLNAVFKEEIGTTPEKYINRRIMLRAEELLRRTNESVHSISEQLGFCDQFYFSRSFSACYGVSPLQYRKNLSYEGALPPNE